MTKRILVIGAGAWGCALALHAARTQAQVHLWARNPTGRLPSGAMPRLPDFPLPDSITVSDKIPSTVSATLVVVPVQHLASVLPLLPAAPTLLCCKGVERNTLAFPLEVLARMRPDVSGGILSGPNFAHEIAAGLPAAAVIAAQAEQNAQALTHLLATPLFRLYASTDCMGVQLGGAAKNVIAIAAGTAIGAGLGENARAALITRGLAETARLAAVLGGSATTLAGLSGMGDLVLTCTGTASRNYQMGLALGRGVQTDTALAGLPGVAEGATTAGALLALAQKHGVSVPIIETVSDLLTQKLSLAQAQDRLLSRPLKQE
ncbi:MAG: NAD(P)H-dependent glycerol-3-phosphate dehydrogenase [Acetobacter orientalis]|uniref:NAD(P)H-dependent glycerol-3-phosphate dehydrogenase n=1 Tax=Acetobacter orientalis TaxID=146474 RepID=UPI0039E8ED2A